MKDQLTIKELAPYLPYGLMIAQESVNGLKCYPLEGLQKRKTSPESIAFIDDKNYGSSYLKGIKPVLRPLSDLAKEIEHNGKKYCLMSLWFSLSAHEEEEYELYKTIPEYWKTVIQTINSKGGIKRIDHGFVQLMYEHHFDVNKLISRGLAIDINTITK